MMSCGPPRVIATSEEDPSHLACLDSTSGSGVAASTRGPISPPPLRRSCSSAPPAASATLASRTGDTTTSSSGNGSGTWTPVPLPERASVPLIDRDSEYAPEMPQSQKPSVTSSVNPAQSMPPATPSRERHHQPEVVQTPKTQARPVTEWTVPTLAKQLATFNQQVRKDHAQLVAHAIESARCREWRTQHGLDLFRELRTHPNPEIKGKQIKIKFKQHNKNKKEQKDVRYNVRCVKTNKPAVPAYRFHHVEIKKNVLMPNTMLTFVPHLRDLEGSEEAKYNLWLKELEDIDLKSGFKPMNRDEKFVAIIQGERAATLSLYLDMWLKELNIPSCNKSTLIRYMASHASDDAITPQQKTDIIKSHSQGHAMTPEEHRAAELFTAAFQLAFKENQPQQKQIELRKVLFLDESVDSVMDNKPAAKEVSIVQQDSEDEVVESNLATYCILGCLICFSHSCDHGEYDIKNWKRTFSLSSCAPLSDILRRKRIAAAGINTIADVPCRRRCYRLKIPPDPTAVANPWTDDERMLLRTLYFTTDFSKTKMDPICLATEFLNRNCDEVYAEFQSLNIGIPGPELLTEPPRPRNISWYDRKRKMLIGDWQEHTITHEHQRRELLEPCSHDGPCAPKICSCVDAGVLCERFCGCTEANCAYKFTGCACHSLGKTCLPKQKDRPCICVQLNRECDPQLCGSCGAFERADPANAEDDVLHSTGCQNCDLQRGRHKALLLGQSQLEGVGYGLFTAEDIAQDEFIVEYVGELITHDEGVRREARRGDVFDETSNISYVFTLLENEGIWVDAAIYGNLSRYINHASEHDTRGCNITPRILYVNGEFRIKFTALRDIKAGEELFFNYGENFPNLTKKLLDNKSGDKPEGPRKVGRPKRAETGDRVARKAPKIEHKKAGRPKSKKKRTAATAATVTTTTTTTVTAAVVAASDDDSAAASPSMEIYARKRKRHTVIDSEEEEYHPPGADTASSTAAHANAEEGELLGSKRLRKTTRSQRAKEPETPAVKTPGSEEPKPRGKRGGARPGSGRPRKHPRVIPRPNKEPSLPAQAAQPAESSQESQLDANTSASAPMQTPTPAPSTPKQSRTGRGEGPQEVVEIEDSEDQDVVTMSRTSRNRRLPAKFREEA